MSKHDHSEDRREYAIFVPRYDPNCPECSGTPAGECGCQNRFPALTLNTSTDTLLMSAGSTNTVTGRYAVAGGRNCKARSYSIALGSDAIADRKYRVAIHSLDGESLINVVDKDLYEALYFACTGNLPKYQEESTDALT